jgi:CRISPR-associated protein Cmr6
MSGTRFEISPQAALHRGLYLDMFIPEEPREAQAVALKHIAEARFDSAPYRMAFQRWRESWTAAGDHVIILEATVRDRMVIGLGIESVAEIGLRLQHTYGTPVIPGSSLKGVLLRGLPTQDRNSSEDKRNVEWYLFGGQKRQGATRFHDAWWIPDNKPPLALDVVTPHHQDYTAGKGPPTDFDEPVPVPLLSIRGRYLFVIEAPTAGWKPYLEYLLKNTLRREGIGGKRSSGYGVFDV